MFRQYVQSSSSLYGEGLFCKRFNKPEELHIWRLKEDLHKRGIKRVHFIKSTTIVPWEIFVSHSKLIRCFEIESFTQKTLVMRITETFKKKKKNQGFTLFLLLVMKMLHSHRLFLFPNCIQCSGFYLVLKEAVTSPITWLHLTLFNPWKMNVTSIFHTDKVHKIWKDSILLSSHFCWKKSFLDLGLCSYYQNKTGKKNKGLHLLHGSIVWCNYYQRSPVCKMFFLIFVPINLNKTSSSLPPRICIHAIELFPKHAVVTEDHKVCLFGVLHHTQLPHFFSAE